MVAIQPRFDDCRECKHFRADRVVKTCRKCTVGEYFEEKFEEMRSDWDHLSFGTERNDD